MNGAGMTDRLEAGQIVVRAEGSMASEMNGDKVMFNSRTGKYYNLGSVGGKIWDLIAEPIDIADIVGALTAQYEIEREACRREVDAFLRQLYRESLIEVSPS